MRYVEVNGVTVSAIGVGCWQFGSKEWGYGDDYARRTAREIVNRALDLGVNLIDTAEIYGMGESERIVGRAIAERRDQVFLATKLFPVLPIPPVVEWRAVESAGRLKVTEIDLYQVHWPNPLAPNAPTMRGMRTLQQIGLVRHVGVSNFNVLRWRTAERMLGSPVLSNQVQYSLAVRKPDRDLVPYAQSNDRLIIAYSPLAQGLLGGRYDVDHPPPPGVRTNNPLFLPDNLEKASRAAPGAPRDRRRPRRHPGPGGAGVGDPPAERGGHPRSQLGGAARGQRGRRRPRPDRRRGRPAHRRERPLRPHPRRRGRSRPARRPPRRQSRGRGADPSVQR